MSQVNPKTGCHRRNRRNYWLADARSAEQADSVPEPEMACRQNRPAAGRRQSPRRSVAHCPDNRCSGHPGLRNRRPARHPDCHRARL